jgi:hypothetical protein
VGVKTFAWLGSLEYPVFCALFVNGLNMNKIFIFLLYWFTSGV